MGAMGLVAAGMIASAGAPSADAPTDGWAGATALYADVPDVTHCHAGRLRDAAKAEMLARLNAVRALHALPPVRYEPSADAEVAEAALMMAANGALSHTPPPSWKCYTATGASGAGTSNLHGGLISPYLAWYSVADELAGWLRDARSATIGHRRWLLSPFLQQIAYGRVDQALAEGRTSAAALKVFRFAGEPAVAPVAPGTVLPDFVGYPFGRYPAELFAVTDLLSFTVVADKTDLFANAKVDLAKARVSVTAGGQALPVSELAVTPGNFGNGNGLQWRVQGLRRGVVTHVTIAGVVGAPATTYAYDFVLEPGPEPDA